MDREAQKGQPGRPRNQQVDVKAIQVEQKDLKLCDVPELAKFYCFISSQSKICLSIKTGQKKKDEDGDVDEERKKEVNQVNKKQVKMLKKYGRSDSHLYFIRRTPDRLKIHNCKDKDGEKIRILNETNYCEKVERPGYIKFCYEQFYAILNILVKELDQEFVPEFMEIVNTFMYDKQNKKDVKSIIQAIYTNITQQEIYKFRLIREWYELKKECHPIQKKYQYKELEKFRKQITEKKSDKIREKLENLVKAKEQEIEIDQEEPNILKLFIKGLVEHLDRIAVKFDKLCIK